MGVEEKKCRRIEFHVETIEKSKVLVAMSRKMTNDMSMINCTIFSSLSGERHDAPLHPHRSYFALVASVKIFHNTCDFSH